MNQTMDHSVAETTHAVERYLLEETSLEERAEFEEHLFDCPICAEEVRTGAIFVDNAKAVFKTEKQPSKSWNLLGWLHPPVLVPSFAALALAAVVGYQNLVTLPALSRPQLLTTTVLAPLSRETAPEEIRVDRTRAMFNVNVAVDSPRMYPGYIGTFESASGSKIEELSTGPKEVSSFTLSILLPTAKFPPGKYVVTVRPSSDPGVSVGRYTFTVLDGAKN